MKLPADQVYVISGNLLSATPSLTDPAVLEDIANSNLLCQLAADKNQGTRFNDPSKWLEFYRTSLGKIFWRITNSATASYPIPALAHRITVKKCWKIRSTRFLIALSAFESKKASSC
ncbi:hypothetical protein NWF32_29330 [Pseudomonas qingdaonensis]|nr:hypothetical protein [Pseudomonas qingdaonensis]